ncbi:MAG TPA: PqqD family protein [Acidimicrobiales bacterium]|nr:PqqD family protein [Acidimicrobiales bacterium]
MPDPRRQLKLRPDELVWRQVGDEVVLLDTASSQYISVNRSGAVMWPLLARGCEYSALVEALVAQFDISHDKADLDAGAFVRSLEDLHLLEGSEHPS